MNKSHDQNEQSTKSHDQKIEHVPPQSGHMTKKENNKQSHMTKKANNKPVFVPQSGPKISFEVYEYLIVCC